ncbi:hypothetical protein B1992_00470 [Pseudoxanthomonas broegbernensis]|uniref:Endonuclease/exonuclease/phosphatase domain-containing protein n=1 Tax=Pseudoxanthomonas broegbernensis TaxID=83619 RepID=A0A7V8K8M8_9GAMM|nr:endonuclease/exonuclease/phosphatase family protein [Pseudoxanthomonas broegbernensis]KAF1687948.1 hypothetical protein B1992_00470 [Pseudoxanthomonas broegbernensis]MBB6064958.1 endonuclease/exonuclease/phosphatase family metal-dependent hydrolase [Pseudoxanthomonas broegbernensis]
MRRSFAPLLALVLAAGTAGAHAGAMPVAAADDAGMAAGFALAVLDLHRERDDWPANRARIAGTLRGLQPDAVALQGVLQDGTTLNQGAWLARKLGYDWHFATIDPPSRPRREGNALLTRAPVAGRGETLLHPLHDRRVAGMVTVLADGRPLNLYVVRLHGTAEGGAVRARQVEDLLSWVRATAGSAPSLIAGDFGAAADAPELALLRAGWDEACGPLHAAAGHPDAAAPATLHAFVERERLLPLAASVLMLHAADPAADDADAGQVAVDASAANDSDGDGDGNRADQEGSDTRDAGRLPPTPGLLIRVLAVDPGDGKDRDDAEPASPAPHGT